MITIKILFILNILVFPVAAYGALAGGRPNSFSGGLYVIAFKLPGWAARKLPRLKD